MAKKLDQQVCAYCQAEAGVGRAYCHSCGAAYHPDCWEENGGCAVPGCDAGPDGSVAATSVTSVIPVPRPVPTQVWAPGPSPLANNSWEAHAAAPVRPRRRSSALVIGLAVFAVLAAGAIGFFVGRPLGYRHGYSTGNSVGYTTGQQAGYASGQADGYATGKTEGYASGYSDGQTTGYSTGFTAGCESLFTRLGTTRLVDYYAWYFSNSTTSYVSSYGC